MIKNFLKKCASFLNRDDLIAALCKYNKIYEIENPQVQNDIFRLLSYCNFVVKNVCENYCDLIEYESLMSDENCKIHYNKFCRKPFEILTIYDSKQNLVRFIPYPEFVDVKLPKELFKVTYKYLPEDINEIDEEYSFTCYIPEKIIIYGVICEFLACKGMVKESEYWKNMFMFEVFKFKVKKERRLKSTF